MFNSISWQAYWTAIALITAGYYVIVFLFVLRKETRFALARGINQSSFLKMTAPDQHSSQADDPSSDFSRPEVGTSEHLVYACVDEISAFMQEAKRAKTSKEEFIVSIKAILAKYPTIKTTEYKAAVTSVLIAEAAHHCSIHFSEVEMDSVW